MPRSRKLRAVCADAERAAILLQHINAGPTVSRVHHELQRPLWIEDVAQRAQSEVRVGQVMQHAGAHDQIERAAEFGCALQRQLMQFEIFEGVLVFEFPCVPQTRFAHVDGRDARLGFAQRIAGRLRGSAASDEDFLPLARFLGGP